MMTPSTAVPTQLVDTDEPARSGDGMDFRRLLEAIPAAAYSTDAEGLITDFNQRAVKTWGREPKRDAPLDRY